MIYQKFIPEGWEINKKEYTEEELNMAMGTHSVLEGKVISLDSSNAYIKLNNKVTGIIPKEELGFYNKNNDYVQFEVMSKCDSNYILSRKNVQKDSLNWAINELKTGEIVSRNRKKYKTLWSFC